MFDEGEAHQGVAITMMYFIELGTIPKFDCNYKVSEFNSFGERWKK